MSSQTSLLSKIKNSSTEFRLVFGVFVFLWLYLIIRSFTVFDLHDELVTKWSYVIHWFPFPNRGNIDANNHFFLSLLAGFFTRIFKSDSMFLLRLGSLLAFPIYFWSIYRLKFLFNQKWNFYALLITLSTTAFLIEFFGLARGYGLALAFLVFSLQQMIAYFHSNSTKTLLGSLIGWILTVYASLTFLPFALIGVGMLGLFTISKSRGLRLRFERRLSGAEAHVVRFIPIVIALLLLAYFVQYSFLLKELDKLYYGGTEGFFVNTVHTLTRYIWSVEIVWVDVLLVLLTGFILFATIKQYSKSKSLFDSKMIFSLFFFLAIAGIFAQRLILEVNFPEDRTALYLVIFFFGALFLSIDQLTHKKGFGIFFIGFSLTFFLLNFNFTHSIAFFQEHLDEELVTLIPKNVKGTPPTTAGRWNMENELTRQLDLPFRMYQGNDRPSDTIVDYMIYYPERRLEISDLYKVIHQDKISGLALLERKKLLSRSKVAESLSQISSEAEYQTFYSSTLNGPMVLRCSGQLDKMMKEKEIFIVFSSQDSLSGQQFSYEVAPMIRNKKINDAGELKFDFSYAMNALDGANSFAVYLWNQNREELGGRIKLEVYKIDE